MVCGTPSVTNTWETLLRLVPRSLISAGKVSLFIYLFIYLFISMNFSSCFFLKPLILCIFCASKTDPLFFFFFFFFFFFYYISF